MKRLLKNRRTLTLIAVLVPLVALFIYVANRSGPLSPVPVTVISVESRSIKPSLFGIGTVEARYTYQIGPTVSGRVLQVNVHVGDRVVAGQVLGEMDPVDLDSRILAQDAAIKRAESLVLAAEADIHDATDRYAFAQTQLKRFEPLLSTHAVSEDSVDIKRLEYQLAETRLLAVHAGLNAARQETARIRADRDSLVQQRANLRLIAPVDGLITLRDAEANTTVVAGQTVVAMIDSASIWINVRFDQMTVSGLQADLPAHIVLRSRPEQTISGKVLRVEPLADAVTEETLAKLTFDAIPDPLPSIGELAEVTVMLPELPAMPVIPNACIRRFDGQIGVWVVEADTLRFAPVKTGAADLDGQTQIRDGLSPGDRVVVYSHRSIDSSSRIKIMDRLPGVKS